MFIGFGALPLEPCLLTFDWVETLVFAFVAFLAACSAARFSLAALMADSRAADLASGLWFLRSLMTSREAPTMALWDLTVLRERFLATSYMVKTASVFVFLRISHDVMYPISI